jgi:flagellar motility protein MotE (MotC chaperone)
MTSQNKIKPKRRSGNGTLIVLALLLATSGALRFGDGIGIVVAGTAASIEDGTGDHVAPALNCPKPPVAVAQALSEREARVTEKEQALENRLAALALANEAIDIRLQQLAASEEKLSETLARADGASEADLTRLTDVYKSMKPKDAAALFATMAPEFAAGFLGRMPAESSAAILSGMTPDDAYAVSVILAGRNAKVPKD